MRRRPAGRWFVLLAALALGVVALWSTSRSDVAGWVADAPASADRPGPSSVGPAERIAEPISAPKPGPVLLPISTQARANALRIDHHLRGSVVLALVTAAAFLLAANARCWRPAGALARSPASAVVERDHSRAPPAF